VSVAEEPSRTEDPQEPDDAEEPDQPPRPPSAAAARRRLLQVLAFATVYVIWGSTYLAIRVAVRSIPPFLMAGCRNLLAGAVLFAALRARGTAAPSRREWMHAAVPGLLMLTVGNGLVSWAEKLVPSNLTALLVAAVPLYVAILDWLRPGGARPRRVVLLGIAIGFAGMVLLAVPGRGGAHGPAVLGVVAVFVSGAAWAAGTLYARYGVRHPSTLMPAAQHMLIGGAALLAVSLAKGDPARLSASAITWQSAVAFGYLVVFGSLVAFSAYGWLVVASTPARLSTTAYVNPVVAVVLGWLLLDESLGGRALAGAALIVLAVVVMTLPRGPRV